MGRITQEGAIQFKRVYAPSALAQGVTIHETMYRML